MFFCLVVSLTPNPTHGQVNNYCDLSDQTIDLFQAGQDCYNKGHYNDAYSYFEDALKNNPYCDDILLSTIQTLIILGTYADEYIDGYIPSTLDLAEQRLSLAQKYLDRAIQYSSNEQNLQDARDLQAQINALRKLHVGLRQIDERREEARKEQLEVATFVQIEVGTGLSYGDMGGRICLYAAPNGPFFTAGFGIGSTPYTLGFGYSFGVYRFNAHIQAAWGSHKFNETFENAWSASAGLNVNIVEHFGIRADCGFWTKTGEDQWVGSIGVFYRYSFTTR